MTETHKVYLDSWGGQWIVTEMLRPTRYQNRWVIEKQIVVPSITLAKRLARQLLVEKSCLKFRWEGYTLHGIEM